MWLQGSSAGSVISRRQLLHSFTPFLGQPKPEAAQLSAAGLEEGRGWAPTYHSPWGGGETEWALWPIS